MIVQNRIPVLTDTTLDCVFRGEVLVESHFVYSDRVWLVIGPTRVLVTAVDLKRAVDNACNHK